MPCLRAKACARAGSRAATALITASGTERAGRMRAIGAIRAAPRMPMRSGAGVVMAAPDVSRSLERGNLEGAAPSAPCSEEPQPPRRRRSGALQRTCERWICLAYSARYGSPMTKPPRAAPPLRFIRSAVRAMEGYTPGEQPQDGSSYIKLNTNENPYPPSARVREAIQRCATDEVRLYPDPMANALRDAAAARYDLTRDHILAGNGSDELLALVLRACSEPGDRVAYPYPTYSLYDSLVVIAGATAVRLPFPKDFSLPEGLGGADARVTIVCNPNAPSGTFVPVDELAALSEQVAGLLVVDEAYVDFAADSALRLVRERGNVLVLRTLSKSFSLAGMRVGLAFGAPPLIAELGKVKDSYNLSRPSIAAGAAALADYALMREHTRRVGV